MCEVRLVIRDARRDVHANCDEEFAECVVAALGAEPETIDELDVAVERFVTPGEWSNFREFLPGADDRPHDAGLVIVDLPARLVVSDSWFPSAAHDDAVDDQDGDDDDADGAPPLRLSEDWELSSDVSGWRALADARRRERPANPPLDARAVLYGEPLLESIGRECWASFRDRPPQSNAAAVDYREHWTRPKDEYELVRQIHVRWMMTPRDDLRGQTPRDVLVARREFISRDMQDRSMQWSHEGQCPRGLDPESAACRFGGFGTHEFVTYYDLVRFLLWICRDDVAEFAKASSSIATTEGDFLTGEVPRLAQLREEWLNDPDPEFHGRTPRSIIHNERARLPEGVSGAEAVVDHDCPMCQMQAELPGPMFWCLDGCNMDDDFAFSLYHRTYEEWEQEQRRHEEFSRRFEAEQAERKRLGVEYPGSGYADPDSVWQRSFSAPEIPGEPALMRLFAIGSHLTELIVDLKQPTEDRVLIDRLSRDFGNLRDVAQSRDFAAAEALFEPVLDRFSETLAEVAVDRPELDRKCTDLQQRLRCFLEPPSSEPTPDLDEDELPF